MLVLRREQQRVFERAAEQRFGAHLRAGITRDWPRLAEALGPEGLRAQVDRAVADARGHGFTEERHLMKYVNVTCALGLDFAVSGRYPWAARILAEPLSPTDRMARLVAATSRHLVR
jgi:hypothetical protein